MGVKSALLNSKGQMTVEFVLVFPLLIIVAVIAVNALLFFGACASFDRTARDAIRTYATSPAYGQGADQIVASIGGELDQSLDAEYLAADVSAESCFPGYRRYTATLRFTPTLFGHGFGGSVFGIPLAPLSHSTSLTVDPYKPGVVG